MKTIVVMLSLVALAPSLRADDQAGELAKQLANPISSLISVPFQGNYDAGSGPTGDGWKFTLNVQPVVPISISKDWNLIVRTIVPIIARRICSIAKCLSFPVCRMAFVIKFRPPCAMPRKTLPRISTTTR